MKKQMKMSGIGFYVLVLAVIFVAVYFSGNIERNSGDSYSISSLKNDAGKNNITSVSIDQNQEIPTGEVTVKLKSGKVVDFYVSDVKEAQKILDENIIGYNNITSIWSWIFGDIFPVFFPVSTVCKFRRRQCQNDEFRKEQSKEN